MAIQHANRILDWFENRTQDEIPPQWMWHLEEELDDFFEECERKRDEKYGRDDDQATDGPGWIQNDLTKDIKRY